MAQKLSTQLASSLRPDNVTIESAFNQYRELSVALAIDLIVSGQFSSGILVTMLKDLKSSTSSRLIAWDCEIMTYMRGPFLLHGVRKVARKRGCFWAWICRVNCLNYLANGYFLLGSLHEAEILEVFSDGCRMR